MIAQPELYQRMNHLFQEIGALYSPTELHAFLSGQFVNGLHLESVYGLQMCAHFLDLSLEELQAQESDFLEFINSTVLVLQQEEFDYRLFIASDEHSLQMRLKDIANWCNAFLVGLGGVAGEEEQSKVNQQREALLDIVEIGKLDSNVDDNDENEQLFIEISEFIRLSVLNLYDELGYQPEDPSLKANPDSKQQKGGRDSKDDKLNKDRLFN